VKQLRRIRMMSLMVFGIEDAVLLKRACKGTFETP
jgi:hypothetical protein